MSRDHDETGGGSDDAAGVTTDSDGEPDDEWQFSLEDLEARETEAEAAAEAERRRTAPVEPGTPSIENTAFVLLGVVLALFIISRLFVG
ncbi:MAG: DUF7312 domain-containing protein [Halobacteriota archaeon]|uniref:DUF7312 domain-containing protein n=1 Tax=Natronomonas sp. TaxID=2184060 RepID=UPI0039763A27